MEADEYLQKFVSDVMSGEGTKVQAVPIKQPTAIRAALRADVLEATATPKQLRRA